MTAQPVTAWVFDSRDVGFIASAIAYVSRRKGERIKDTPSHCGLGFDMNDGSQVYYEAHSDNGFGGPWSIVRLQSWIARKTGRWARRYTLPLSSAAVARLYELCERQRGVWPYPLGQLVQMWRWTRFSLPITASDDAVVCSEAVSRLVHMADGSTHIPTIAGRPGHDYIAPSDVAYAMREIGIEPEFIE